MVRCLANKVWRFGKIRQIRQTFLPPNFCPIRYIQHIELYTCNTYLARPYMHSITHPTEMLQYLIYHIRMRTLFSLMYTYCNVFLINNNNDGSLSLSVRASSSPMIRPQFYMGAPHNTGGPVKFNS